MRPASLMQSALPDLERPAMARAIAAQRHGRLWHAFSVISPGAWPPPGLVNILACAALLAFFPLLVLKKGYAPA